MSQQINLFNPLFRKLEFSWTSADAMLYGVAALVALTALYSGYLNYRLNRVQREAQAVEQQFNDMTSRRDQLQTALAQRKPNQQLADEVAALEAKLKARQQIVEILQSGALGTTSGFSEYMRAFSRQTVNGLWLTGFDITNHDLVIEGRTLSPDLLPDYLQRLNQEPALQGKQFAALHISRPPAEPAATPSATQASAGASPDSGGTDKAPARFLEFVISTSETTGAAEGPASSSTSQPASQNFAGTYTLARSSSDASSMGVTK